MSEVVRRRARWAILIGLLVVVWPAVAWASHQFVDVPDGQTFHEDIDWLAANQVTLGCNPPTNNRFCPEDSVTRGEMAAFMRRLAEGRVVDAGTVRGRRVNQLGGSGTVASIANREFPGNEAGKELYSAVVNVPARGGALSMTADIAVATDPGGFGGVFWTEVDDGTCDVDKDRPTNSESGYIIGSSGGTDSGTVTWSRPVPAGRHTVSFCHWDPDPVTVVTSSVTVTWAPSTIRHTSSAEEMGTVAELAAHLEDAGSGDDSDG